MIIKGASGFGDSIYLYPIIKYYMNKGEDIIVKTDYPEIFQNLNCKCIPFHSNEKSDINCNYWSRKWIKKTTQFEDMCILAGIKEKIELKINNDYGFKIKLDDLSVIDKKVCIIQKPYFPMNEDMKRYWLMPKFEIMQKLINDYKDKYYFIQVGKTGDHEDKLFKFSGIYCDTVDKLTISEVLGLINFSYMFISQIGWGIAVAEALNKKIFVLFKKAIKSDFKLRNNFKIKNKNKIASEVRSYMRNIYEKNNNYKEFEILFEQWFGSLITPKKVITKDTSYYCIDNEPYKQIKEKFENAIR